MPRIHTNGLAKDYVIKPFERLAREADQIQLAAPYFTRHDLVVAAAEAGKSVRLLIGLNNATSPDSVTAVVDVPNLQVRFLTDRFHAKIYLFDGVALLGSSNLTNGGLMQNREAVVSLHSDEDLDAVEEVRALFVELWDAADVLTKEKARAFRIVHAQVKQTGPDPKVLIEDAVGRAPPPNVHVASLVRSRERMFLESLRRTVYEAYRPAFTEVTQLLGGAGYRRPELEGIGSLNETNRFLNWVRLSHVHGDTAWRTAPALTAEDRRVHVLALGADWASAADNKVPASYLGALNDIRGAFASLSAVENAGRDGLTVGLMALHAFYEQSRFVKGGAPNLPGAFWASNGNDVPKVTRTLGHLLHGSGDFVERLHDTLYDPSRKLGHFGLYCALELFGTVRPDLCPPVNGRMAKALRFLGFTVHAA
ncbi:phospholipase D family protein [Methylobacterium bullatum]|uniref:Phospholipase D n=1 Tax=Methylobacterium bullatum TaxID=570505 RepID=A0A679JKI6_9HYPH|nr:hypothetical protein MBLL_00391 [Methylobacterium bullatum]